MTNPNIWVDPDFRERDLSRLRKRSEYEMRSWLAKRSLGYDCRNHAQSQAHLSSILAAVYGNNKPSRRINHRRLRLQIEQAKTSFQLMRRMSSESTVRERAERLESVVKGAELVLAQFQGGEGFWCYDRVGSSFPAAEGSARPDRGHDLAPSMRSLRAGLERLKRTATRERLAMGKIPAPGADLGYPVLAWFVRERLPPIFERWFGQKATANQSRTESKDGVKYYPPDSPYIRFAIAVISEWESPPSAKTIMKYLKSSDEYLVGRRKRRLQEFKSKPRLPG